MEICPIMERKSNSNNVDEEKPTTIRKSLRRRREATSEPQPVVPGQGTDEEIPHSKMPKKRKRSEGSSEKPVTTRKPSVRRRKATLESELDVPEKREEIPLPPQVPPKDEADDAEARRKAQEELMAQSTIVAETQHIDDPPTKINSTDTNPLMDPSEPALKKKREGLVTDNIISSRDEDENHRKGIKKSKIKEPKMKLARQKGRAKGAAASLSGKSKKKAKTCEAGTSSGPSKKIKDKFRKQIVTVIVTYLYPYRKPDCRVGRIANIEDFKYLAKTLTHFVMAKELSRCSIEDLQCDDNLKHKARVLIRKYMCKFGAVYSRSPDD